MERRPRMSEQELAACFRAAPEHPMWRGVLEVLDEQIIAASGMATDPKLPDGERAYLCGGVQFLVEAKAELQKLAEAAHKGGEQPGEGS
jgi:hypothetical protein